MTFLQALYGSQYQEISQRGGDGQKGRLNGNLFLAAFIFLLLLFIFLITLHFFPLLNHTLGSFFGAGEAPFTARTQGKLMTLPVLGIIYYILTKTTGNEKNYNEYVAAFMQYSDDIKAGANKKILIPFFLLLITVMVTAIL